MPVTEKYVYRQNGTNSNIVYSDVPLKAKSRHLKSLERVKRLGADYVNTVAKDSAQ